ncbi:HAD family hydrolase [Anaerotalea alkaliphila]|uniref:HAD hydrolase-like protein n=1 Tax=Anaerotalea alkaliphila TaxID=2662126 RepID=A0A7X5HVG7_9FIRM|nr:HAD hydrolase-like protein [Anaerotalea alkaliphila]NDL67407.1 HAD hydrolase-like protein [Anaerotalea alkaliphila]
MEIKLVIFDLDGTLVDSLPGLAHAMNLVLAEEGYPLHPEESYRHFVGHGIKNLVFKALPEEAAREEALLEACHGKMLGTYGRDWDHALRLYEGIPSLLDALKERGIRMAVNTNKDQAITRKIMETAGTQPEETLYVGDTLVDVETARNSGAFCAAVTWGFRTREELEEGGVGWMVDRPLELLEILEGRKKTP